MRFQDKRVFITGGTKGLGRELARAFIGEGATVGVNGRTQEAIDRFLEEFSDKGAIAFKSDISNYDEIEDMVTRVIERWARVDIIVNNAGVASLPAPAEKIKRAELERVIDVNIKGTFYVTQAFGSQMIKQGKGRIINIASQAGLYGEKGFLPYAMSKAAIILMTHNLAYEWSGYGVTLCGIAPGFIKGGMNEGLLRREAFVDYLSRRTPIKRMCNVDEFVSTILFLATDAASYINGETIVMDGGMTGYIEESFVDFMMKAR
jgi:NAD(P)-dependent dehydrogenase (short-subunit alcohol dehydrogenase family)